MEVCLLSSRRWWVNINTLTDFNSYHSACKQFLEAEDLPDAYDVPGSTVPGSQTKTFTVNSVKNTDHAGDGPGSLDYDMDASLMGYQPLEVRFIANKYTMTPKQVNKTINSTLIETQTIWWFVCHGSTVVAKTWSWLHQVWSYLVLRFGVMLIN